MPDALAPIETVAATATPSPSPLAVNRAGFATAFGFTEAHVDAMVRKGLCPLPAQVGGGRCPRWSRRELLLWLENGAPPRRQWDRMREAILRRAGGAL